MSFFDRDFLEATEQPPSVVHLPPQWHARTRAQRDKNKENSRLELRWIVSGLVMFLTLSALAHAQPSAELKIPKEIFANESIAISVSVFDARTVREPEFPEIPGCEIRGGGREQETRINNGRITSWIRYNYEFVATKSGDFVIPAIEVMADGKFVKTAPTKVTVLPSDAADLCQAEITVDTKRLFVGQQATFKLTVLVRQATYNRQLLDRDTTERFLDTAWGNLGAFRKTGRGTLVRRPDTSGQAQTFHAFEYVMDAVLDQPGPLPFGDILVGVAYPRFERDSFTNGARVAEWRKLRIIPEVNVPEVLALPTAGRPSSFTGAVGVYRIDVSAKPLRVRVGDPIEVTMSIAGRGSLETLPPPALALQSKLTDAFRVPVENLAGKLENGRRVFSQSIRAKRSDITEIPPIEYAYFDADRGEYAVTSSAAIPIRIDASNQLDVGTLTELGVPNVAAKSVAVETVDGLLGNIVDESSLLNKRTVFGMRELAIVTFAPPAVFILGCAWSAASRRRGDNGVEQRRKLALPTALRKFDAAASLPARERGAAMVAALGGYLADRTNEPAGRFAGGAIARWLQEQGANEPVVAECGKFVERCESAAYGGAEGEDDLATAAKDCIQRLEREVFS